MLPLVHKRAAGRSTTHFYEYPIFLDGEKVGELWGYSDTRLSDGGSGHKGKAFGVKLSNAGVRGAERERMEAEIADLAARHKAQ